MKLSLDHFGPALPAPPWREPLRAGGGALLGIGLCALFAWITGMPTGLIAPLGASAVLIFCVPNAPLAQPWSAVVGNTASALVALAVVLIAPPSLAAPVAVGAAIAVMMLLRALHPPGGAVALLMALAPAATREAGPLFALVPVGALSAVLVIAGVAYNRLSGRVYPFRQPAPPPTTPEPRLGLSTEQLEALLIEHRQTPNLGVADLGRLLAAAEAEAASHRFDGTTCGDIMTRDLITVAADTPVKRLARLFRDKPIKSLPVTDGDRLLGIVMQADLMGEIAAHEGRRPRRRGRVAGDVMREPPESVTKDTPVGKLLNRLAKDGPETVIVTNNDRLCGVITRSDILRLLLHEAEQRAA